MIGLATQFESVYRDRGLGPAAKWIGRCLATSVFHDASYSLVGAASPVTLDRDDLERRLQRNGTIEYYDRERTVEVERPPGTDHVDPIAERAGTYAIRRPFVGELRDVRLVGSYPIPIDRTNRIVLEAVGNPEVLTLNAADSIRDLVADPVRTPSAADDDIDSAVLLYNHWNRGYYHWTVETLTRLEGVERYRERTGESPKLIVGPDPTRFQLQTLELLGYDRDDLIEWDLRSATVDRLIVPSMRRELNPGTVSPMATHWLRDRMRSAALERAPEVRENASKRVYVSREDAPRRQVVNEDALCDVLDRYGFEKYVLSERSVAENVALFDQADTIVAPHGAGLTDLIYGDDVTVLELFRSNDVRPTYYVLSELLGHRYRYALCDYEGPNLVVDPDEVDEILSEEVSRERTPTPRPVSTAAGSSSDESRPHQPEHVPSISARNVSFE